MIAASRGEAKAPRKCHKTSCECIFTAIRSAEEGESSNISCIFDDTDANDDEESNDDVEFDGFVREVQSGD